MTVTYLWVDFECLTFFQLTSVGDFQSFILNFLHPRVIYENVCTLLKLIAEFCGEQKKEEEH